MDFLLLRYGTRSHLLRQLPVSSFLIARSTRLAVSCTRGFPYWLFRELHLVVRPTSAIFQEGVMQISVSGMVFLSVYEVYQISFRFFWNINTEYGNLEKGKNYAIKNLGNLKKEK